MEDGKSNKAVVKITGKGDEKTYTKRKNALFIAFKEFIPELEIKLEEK